MSFSAASMQDTCDNINPSSEKAWTRDTDEEEPVAGPVLHLQSTMDEVETNEFFADKSDGFRQMHDLWRSIQRSSDSHGIEVNMHVLRARIIFK